MGTGMSFRPGSTMSIGPISMTTSSNFAPMLKSTYLSDFEKTYRTLDFGVAGRKGINYQNKIIDASQKYR